MHENNPEEENGICGVHVDRAVPELSCGPPDVGIIRSMEKDREIPLEVGVNMSPEVVVIPQEMGKESNADKVKHTEKVDKFSAVDQSAKEYVERGQSANLMKGNVHTLDDSSKKPNSYTSPCERNRYCGVIFGDWDDTERLRSSTWREAETVRRVINSNIEILQHKKVKVFSDNKNVMSVLQIGSSKNDLQNISCDVNDICELHDIKISPEWIPRDQNQKADDLSRYGDCDDWSVSDEVFSRLNIEWGPHTIDRFACMYNTKCQRFNSRFWVPGTEAVNSLDQNWSDETNWIVPPPVLILKCIRKIELEKASGTMIVPLWKSAPYWPDLHADDGFLKRFIAECRLLPTRNAICKGRGNNGIFRKPLSFRMVALKVRF